MVRIECTKKEAKSKVNGLDNVPGSLKTLKMNVMNLAWARSCGISVHVQFQDIDPGIPSKPVDPPVERKLRTMAYARRMKVWGWPGAY